MKISIIITAYNAEKYIRDTIDSCINQTYQNLEIIIVNDCSTDTTLQIIESYKDPRIRIINHDENLGCGLSKRTGINAATGEYFILLDSDDWLDLQFIKKAVDNIHKTNADIIEGRTIIVKQDDSTTYPPDCFEPKILKGNDKLVGDIIRTANNKLIKTTLSHNVQWNPSRFIEDTQTLIVLLYFANKVSRIDEPAFYYRRHKNGLFGQQDKVKINICQSLCYAEVALFLLNHWDSAHIAHIYLQSFYGTLLSIKYIRLTQPESLKQYEDELKRLVFLTLDINSKMINLII